MRSVQLYLDLSLPCEFADESYSAFEDYLEDRLGELRIAETTLDDGITINVNEITVDVRYRLQVSISVEGLVGDEYSDISEDEFIETYQNVFDKYISYTLVPEINKFFYNDYILGYMPDARIAFIDDSLYVELGARQTKLDLDVYPTTVEYTDDVDDLVSDLYYTQD